MISEGEKIKRKAFKEFISEAEELIDKLSKNIQEMDAYLSNGKVPPDMLNEIFRGAHSLKGLTGMFGFVQMSALSHHMENLLDNLRLDKVILDKKLHSILTEGVDLLSTRLKKLTSGGTETEGEFEEFIKTIEDTISGSKPKKEESVFDSIGIDSNVLGVLTEYEEHRLKENIKSGSRIYKISAVFDLSSFDEDLSKLNDVLKSLGEIITTLPGAGAPGEAEIKFDIILGTDKDQSAINELLKRFGVEITEFTKDKRHVQPQAAAPEKIVENVSSEQSVSQEEVLSVRSVSQTVRVDISKLDYIMNIVGELFLSRIQISEIASQLRNKIGFTGFSAGLYKASRELERKLNELRISVMGVRMVPLRQVFDKLIRVVRRLADSSGKKISLDIFGADTELDKLIIEEIADPLMHIIRNSIDHGIEEPQEREKMGKDPTGKITINAYQKGNHVVIEVIDDGRGIDVNKIIKVAQKRNLANVNAQLSKQDAFEFLFRPGFTTKEVVSEISGRGVGLDVVKNKISALSGMIDIESEVGFGTRFIITLPITLAIIQALMVDTSGRLFAIPLSSVLESLVVSEGDIKRVEKKQVLQLRESTLPLIKLSEIFTLPDNNEKKDKFFVVVVGLAERRLGILVDKLIGQQDIVIKPVGEILKNIKGIAGATELGTKQAVLVLDVGAVLEESLKLKEA